MPSTDIKDYYRRAWGLEDRPKFKYGGSWADWMTNFSDQMTFEEYLQMDLKNKKPHILDRKAEGGRIGFAGGRLVKTGPNKGKYFYYIGKGDNYRTYYADSPTDGEAWVTKNRKKKGWTKKIGSKITMTEKNKAAQKMFGKNYNELPPRGPKSQKTVYDNIYGTFKTKTDKPGKFKVKTQASALSATDQAKIKKVYPNAKFTAKNTYGFPPDHPKYDEVWRFVDRGFKKSYQRLPKYLQTELENAFPRVKFNWDGKSKYGVPSSDVNLYKKVSTYLDNPKPWRYTFDLKTAEGWMASQMDRASLQGNTQYKSLTEKFTVTDKKGNKQRVDKVVAVKDGNKTYFTDEVLREKFGKKGDLLIKNHPDFANTRKYWNIADKTSKALLSDYDNLVKLLPEGFDPKKIRLNDLLQFIGDKEGIQALNRAKRFIEIHHEYGVGTKATKNYQLLRRDLNALGNTLTNKINSGTLSAADEALAKNIRLNIEGTQYGPKRVSPTQDIKTIISQAESEMKAFKTKDWDKFKKLLSPSDSNKVSTAIQSIMSKKNSGLNIVDIARWGSAELSVLDDIAGKIPSKALGAFGRLLKGAGIVGIPLDVIPIAEAHSKGLGTNVGLMNLAEIYTNLPGIVWEAGEWLTSKAKGKEHEWKPPYETTFGQEYQTRKYQETPVEELEANISNLPLAEGYLEKKIGIVPEELKVIDAETKEALINQMRKEKALADQKKKEERLTGVDKYILSNLDV
jgi:hypothetical protein